MNRILKYFAAASVIVLALSSCMRNIDPEVLDGPYISLGLNALDPTVITKAEDREGITDDNENLIKSFDYFIYTEGNTGANAVKKSHVDVANGAQISYTYKIGVKASDVDLLFPNGSQKCTIFVVVNWTGSSRLSDMEDTRLGTLKALVAETDFLAADAEGKPQPSFIMTGQADCNKGNKNDVVIAKTTIDLKRLASKISLGVSVARYYDEKISETETVRWESNPGNMSVIFCNANKRTTLSGIAALPAVEDLFSYGSFSSDNFNPTKGRMQMKDTGAKDPKLSAEESGLYGNVWTCDRFYSYPQIWEDGSENDPYLLVRLYWTNTVTGMSTPLFYKVILPGNKFDANYWYHINLRLSALGSLTPKTDDVVIPEDFTYYVADWNQAGDGGDGQGHYVEAEIRNPRYLMVEKTIFEMNNQNTLVIPFKSSHPCVLAGRDLNVTKQPDPASAISGELSWKNNWSEDIKPIVTMPLYYLAAGSTDYGTKKTLCYKSNTTGSNLKHSYSYKYTKNERDYTKNIEWSINGFSITVNQSTNQVEIRHDLRNDTSASSYDYAPYSVTFRIQHSDNPNVFEEITVIQYPALYIESDTNTNGASATVKPNNTFVNNGHGNDGVTSSAWGTSYDYKIFLGTNPNEQSNRGNTNGNMYVITTTVLPDDKYILADPRTMTIDNLNTGWDNWSQSAPSMQGENRRLTYYYPTAETPEADQSIAPKFRIASSYGACQPVTYVNAQRRCASYQEQGRPAGRWRLPTSAEVKYMAKLSGDGVIPILLSDESIYWCSGGAVQPNFGDPKYYDKSEIEHTNVRCVYDEWYWENHDHSVLSNQKTFTWGDYAR